MATLKGILEPNYSSPFKFSDNLMIKMVVVDVIYLCSNVLANVIVYMYIGRKLVLMVLLLSNHT